MHCAVKIQKIITNELRNADGQIGVGIGINYGPVVIGNMGAKTAWIIQLSGLR
jgi:class 3 adenylate cyclase